mgnify:CR=1 FL=1|jgi:HPt (histidine-containing phosphotransfer) domain-containing protein
MSHKLYDIEQLKKQTGGDPYFTNHMINVFINEAPKLINELNKHYINKNNEGVKFTSHQLKGNFKSMGIHCWKDLKAIELAAIENELDKVQKEIESVHDKFPKVIEALKQEL